MSEVIKLYENCNIKPKQEGYCDWDSDCPYSDIISCGDECSYWKYEDEAEYPPFTPEKQLEIVKQILFSKWWMNLKRLQFSEKFDEGLAQMINELWQDLSEEEKQQVKNILEMNIQEVEK